MIDCSKDIRDYHDVRVKLTDAQTADLKKKRASNRRRVEDGLEANHQPAPTRFVTQGSFAMGTIIQEANNAYDLDEGVVFTRESLKGAKGADKTALDARKVVRDAVDDGSFKNPPLVKLNCVRIFYSDGVQVDMPVYRCEGEEDWEEIELASQDWKVSNPEGVNDWFAECCATQPSLRRLVRLVKSLCKNRPSYSLPSGLVLSVLAHECYPVDSGRIDRDLRRTIEAIHTRLVWSLVVKHPLVDGEYLTKHANDPKVAKFRDVLTTAVEDLNKLDLPNCSRSMALKKWKKVLCTNYFDSAIKEAEQDEKEKAAKAVAALGSTQPKPWVAQTYSAPSSRLR